MKARFFGAIAPLALGSLLALAASSSHAAAQWRYVEPGVALPPAQLTAKEFVEILADYSVIHQDAIVGGYYSGVMSPLTKKIHISDEFDEMIRRVTVIHEFLHVYYLKKHNLATGGYPPGEIAIEAEASRIYEELFVEKK